MLHTTIYKKYFIRVLFVLHITSLKFPTLAYLRNTCTRWFSPRAAPFAVVGLLFFSFKSRHIFFSIYFTILHVRLDNRIHIGFVLAHTLEKHKGISLLFDFSSTVSLIMSYWNFTASISLLVKLNTIQCTSVFLANRCK
jgi:hypothetical protein